MASGRKHLRVLIANENLDRLGLLATVVEGLGHEVIARSVSVRECAATTAREPPGCGAGRSRGKLRARVGEALERAKAVVTRSLEELKSTGLSTEQLIRSVGISQSLFESPLAICGSIWRRRAS
jgi:hypothetical protein